MPHKYEREIEEILRNMDDTESRHPRGGKIRAFQRPVQRQRPRPVRRSVLPRRDGLILFGLALALIGAGTAYYLSGANAVTGGIAIAAFVLIVLGFVGGWAANFGWGSKPTVWRGQVVDAAPGPTPIRRRGLFSEVATRVRILRLKVRYWRSHER